IIYQNHKLLGGSMIVPITVPFPKDWGRGDASHIYLLKYDKNILIDAGLDSAENRKFVVRTLKEIDSLNLEYILVTHGHLDHFGLAGFLQRETGAEVLIHESDAVALKDYRKVISWFDEVYDYAVEGGYESQELEKIRNKLLIAVEMIKSPDVYRFFKDIEVNVGEYALKSLHLPGHTPGSVGYVLGNSIFSGDVAIEGSTAVGEFRQELDSLQKLKSFKYIYAGHRKTPLSVKDIEELEAHFVNRLEEVLKTIRFGMKLRDIVNKIYGETDDANLIRKIIPIRQTLSYLKYLEEEGYAIKKGALWISLKDTL
ncbi:MAG: MBL fold metallo-hydrolase, partial [Candidatus Methanomethylicaceae archaeon]